MVSIVAAIAEDGTIGHKGYLPWKFSEDLQRFRTLTWGGTVLVGAKTAATLPPLPGRHVVVLHRSGPTLERAIANAGDPGHPVWVAGGAEVYAAALSYASELHITRVPGYYGGDTRWLPDLSEFTRTRATPFIARAPFEQIRYYAFDCRPTTLIYEQWTRNP